MVTQRLRGLAAGAILAAVAMQVRLAAPAEAAKTAQSRMSTSVRAATAERLGANAQLERWKALRKRASWKALAGFAEQRGFRVPEYPAQGWVRAGTVELSNGEEKPLEIACLDLEPKSARSRYAACILHVSAGKKTYDAILIAPNGKPEQAREYRAAPGRDARFPPRVILAHSWWSCVIGHLPDCAGPCASALATCIRLPFSWTNYLGCLAAQCGSCFVRYAAICLAAPKTQAQERL